DDSIRLIRQAMRLNPHHPFFYLWTLGHAYYLAGRSAEAVSTLEEVLRQNPNFLPAHAYLAVLFSEMGRAKQAEEAWDRARRLSPRARLETTGQRLPYRRPADLDRFLTAAHASGLR